MLSILNLDNFFKQTKLNKITWIVFVITIILWWWWVKDHPIQYSPSSEKKNMALSSYSPGTQLCYSYLIKHILGTDCSHGILSILQRLFVQQSDKALNSRELCCVQPQKNCLFIHPCRIKATLGMAGVGKREIKYIRDRMDIPKCGNTF